MNLVVFDIGGTSVKYGRYQDGSIENKSSFATPKTWEEMKENLHQVVKTLSDMILRERHVKPWSR